MNRPKLFHWLALASLITFPHPAAHAADVRAVTVAHARRGDVARNITLPAVVRADQETVLYAKITGHMHADDAQMPPHSFGIAFEEPAATAPPQEEKSDTPAAPPARTAKWLR